MVKFNVSHKIELLNFQDKNKAISKNKYVYYCNWSWRFDFTTYGGVHKRSWPLLILTFALLSLFLSSPCIAFHPLRFLVCHPVLIKLEGICKKIFAVSYVFFCFLLSVFGCCHLDHPLSLEYFIFSLWGIFYIKSSVIILNVNKKIPSHSDGPCSLLNQPKYNQNKLNLTVIINLCNISLYTSWTDNMNLKFGSAPHFSD